jgi:hypothetical protein
MFEEQRYYHSVKQGWIALSNLKNTALKNDIDNREWHLIVSMLRTEENPDRRLDCLVTALTLGPANAFLDEEGFDGWDILTPSGGGSDIWMEASDILYITRHADAALELCQLVAGPRAPALIASALSAVTRRQIGAQEDIAGTIARYVTAELLEWAATR